MKNLIVRNCPNPNCKKVISYSRIYDKDNAEKQNTKCKTCSKIGISRSEETRKKISKSMMGDKNPTKRPEVRKKISENHSHYWKEKTHTKETKQKIRESKKGKKRKPFTEEWKKNISESKKGENNPVKRPEVRKKISESLKGIKRSEETRKKQRLSAIKRIEKQNGQISPNYNSGGCEIINWYNMYYGFNFQHAENGGEVCIDGYWPDGIDEKRKTIIEVDEKHHFNSDGKLKQKDIRRQNYLENMGYRVIRMRI